MQQVKKRLPVEFYDIAGLEDWFSEMAAQGLFLTKCTASRATFSPGQPKSGIRYRLEAQGVYETDPNRNAAYAQFGWEYVCTIRNAFYVYRCGDPNAHELHTDPVVQSETMRSLIRRKLSYLIFLPLWYIFIFRDEVKLLFTAPEQLLINFVRYDGTILITALMAAMLLWSISFAWHEFATLNRIKKRLAQGLPIDRSKRYPRSFFRNEFCWLVFIGAILSLIFIFLLEERARDFSSDDHPYITLEQVLAPLPLREHPGSFFREGEKMHTSVLAPVQLEYGQTRLLGEGMDEMSVRVYLEYDNTRSPALARMLMEGQISIFFSDMEKADTDSLMLYHYAPVALGELTELKHPNFDELYYLDYTYKKAALPQRAYFATAGSQSIYLVVSRPLAERALELLALQLN